MGQLASPALGRSSRFCEEILGERTQASVNQCNTVVRPSDDLSLVFTSVQEVKSDQYRVSYYETAELNGSDSSGSRGQ